MSAVSPPQVIQLAVEGFELQRVTVDNVELLHKAYREAAADEAVVREFSSSIAAYSDTLAESRARVERLYDTAPQQRIGYLVVNSEMEKAVGMTYLGIRPDTEVFSHDSTVTRFKGINFSSWLLAEARNRGIRCAIGDSTTNMGRILSQSTDPDDQEWVGGTIYTGVREGNSASERVVTKLGYNPVGILLHDSAYRAWLKPLDFKDLKERQLQIAANS
jgi:hypothetical protein